LHSQVLHSSDLLLDDIRARRGQAIAPRTQTTQIGGT
jgi:hypothetical protein